MSTWYHDRALSLITSYILELKKPRSYSKKEVFRQRSFAIWAAEECYEYVRTHDYIPPLDAVNAFIRIMEDYSCLNPYASIYFSIASDTGKDILDKLLTNI